jgi:hypothetical protein
MAEPSVCPEVIRMVKEMVRMHGVRIHVHRGLSRDYAFCPIETIYVSPWHTESRFISCAMHELQHILNKREGKYPAYHGRRGLKAASRAIILHGLQAERYTDLRARELCRSFFPWVRYYSAYRYEYARWWYNGVYKEAVKHEYLKRFRKF